MNGSTSARSLAGRVPGRAAWVAALLAVALGAAGLAPTLGGASSHREAPLIAADPQADTTDVYAFRSPDKPSKVTLVANYIPFEEPAGGPNFYAFANKTLYDIKVDNDGDAKADVTFRWIFKNHYRNRNTFLYNTGRVTSLSDPDLNFYQTYSLTRLRPGRKPDVLARNLKVAPSHVGVGSMPNYQTLRDQATRSFGIGGGRGETFAGQADDAFFLDLRVFDLLYGGNLSEVGDDTVAGFNVNTIAVQIPRANLAKGGNVSSNPIIGTWSTSARPTKRVLRKNGSQKLGRGHRTTSRLGMPLVNELVIPLKDKNRWNASKPRDDAQFLEYVNDPIVPRVVNQVYGFSIPDSRPNKPGIQRDDLIEVFLTGLEGLNQPRNVRPSEELRLNMTTPVCEPVSCGSYSSFGVIGGDEAGYPNGRRLADDVTDITLRVAEGILLPPSQHDVRGDALTDGVQLNDSPFGNTFPYVSLPSAGSDASPH
ncbi:MAG: DUF4331 domain-containing protein [Actinobacteria bacterium]|nr:DUF4331 domain-containing protein [Actinomycetota bacterium]